MSRNAGFSVAASIVETAANDFIRTYFANNIPPQPIPLPPTVTVGAVTVTLMGSVAVLPPEVTFASNPQNAVTVNAAMIGRIGFAASGSPNQNFDVILFTTLALPLAEANDGSLLFPAVNFALATVNSVGVEVLRNRAGITGAALLPVYQAALTSGPILTALTNGLRTFVPAFLPIAPFNFPSIFHQDVHRGPPKGTSEFGPFPVWFSIDLTPTRLVAVVLDGALALGLDINGYTNGDPGQLEDLNTDFAPGSYVRTLSSTGGSSFGATPSGPRNSHLAVAVSPQFIQSLVDQQVTPKIAGTLVDDHVAIVGLDTSFGFFTAGIYGTGFGLTLTAHAVYYADTHRLSDGFGYFAPNPGTTTLTADVTAHLEYYLETRDGTTSFVAGHPDAWQFRVVETTVSLPPWLEAAAVFGAIAIAALLVPANLALILGPITAAEIGSTLDNAAAEAAGAGGNALQSATTLAQRQIPFPGTTAPLWLTIINGASVDADGFDLSLKYAPTDSAKLMIKNAPPGYDSSWPVTDSDPIVVFLSLPSGEFRADDPSLFATWKIIRTDTNAVLFTLNPTQQLSAVGGVASVEIDHASPALADAPGFLVNCVCSRLLGYRTDTIFNGWLSIVIEDAFDRHHPYVHWDHKAYFPTPGSPLFRGHPTEYWSRARKSAIHRTEVAARCLEMRRRTSLAYPRKVAYQYLDALPPGLGQQGRQAPRLCQYCFYGGPTRTVPIP